MNLNTFGGRKFLMTLGCGVATTLLQFFGKLDAAGNAYTFVIIGTVGVYITGNVAQKKVMGSAEADS